MKYLVLALVLLSHGGNFAQASADAPKHTAADGFQYTEDCARSNNWNRVEKSSAIQKMIKFFSGLVHQQLPVYSCFRDQGDQDKILRANHCAPAYGKVHCAGRIAADISEHTIGTAADFYVQNYHGKTADLCRELDQMRKSANGGRGGITVYGIDSSGKAALHVDVKEDWCNWGECEKSMGEGYCRRTKFRQKEAELEKSLAAAKLSGSQANVKKIQGQMSALEADCPPGKTSCRDNYQPGSTAVAGAAVPPVKAVVPPSNITPTERPVVHGSTPASTATPEPVAKQDLTPVPTPRPVTPPTGAATSMLSDTPQIVNPPADTDTSTPQPVVAETPADASAPAAKSSLISGKTLLIVGGVAVVGGGVALAMKGKSKKSSSSGGAVAPSQAVAKVTTLKIISIPTTAKKDAVLSDIELTLVDASGAIVADGALGVTVACTGCAGTLSAKASSGHVHFTQVKITQTGAVTLRFSASGVADITSDAVQVAN